MDRLSIAPCGVICDICSGFQRDKNKKNYCIGCRREGIKPAHCKKCVIKNCPEKNGNTNELCIDCNIFPCRRIKNLHKRYLTRYNEDINENMKLYKDNGIKTFVKIMEEKWKCKNCGKLLCVHKELCLHCEKNNPNHIKNRA
jgi:hypothetical protein